MFSGSLKVNSPVSGCKKHVQLSLKHDSANILLYYALMSPTFGINQLYTKPNW